MEWKFHIICVLAKNFDIRSEARISKFFGSRLGLCNDLETIYCSQDHFYRPGKDILLFFMSKSQDSSAVDLVKFLE